MKKVRSMPRRNKNGRARGHQELNGDKMLTTLSAKKVRAALSCTHPHDKERTYKDRSTADTARELIEPFVKAWHTRIRRCNLHQVYLLIDVS